MSHPSDGNKNVEDLILAAQRDQYEQQYDRPAFQADEKLKAASKKAAEAFEAELSETDLLRIIVQKLEQANKSLSHINSRIG